VLRADRRAGRHLVQPGGLPQRVRQLLFADGVRLLPALVVRHEPRERRAHPGAGGVVGGERGGRRGGGRAVLAVTAEVKPLAAGRARKAASGFTSSPRVFSPPTAGAGA